MKNKIISILLLITFTLLCSCSNSNPSSNGIAFEEKTDNQTGTSKADIVLVFHYRNWTWGYWDSGSFIDKYGNVYEFDFSTGDETYPDEDLYTSFDELLDIFEKIMIEEKSPAYTINFDDLKKYETILNKINLKAEYEEAFGGNDAGQNSCYLVHDENGKTVMTLLYSNGDETGALKDRYVDKFKKCWEE